MKFIRKDAFKANNGGQFLHEDGSYTDLYWYAVAIGKMKEKPISDPTSWWFYAAIHGQYIIPTIETTAEFIEGRFQWKDIPGVPVPKKEDGTVDISKLPSQKHIDDFWDQCQHATWFFLPWHRGYLAALEHIMRDIIVNELDGPANWALPYWNYLPTSKKESETYKTYIPDAFTQLYLPDGKTPNPLYIVQRYGPDSDGNIYILDSNFFKNYN